MLPIRITLAGCSTRSCSGVPEPSAATSTGEPSGPMISGSAVCSAVSLSDVMSPHYKWLLTALRGTRNVSEGEDDLADVLGRLEHRLSVSDVGDVEGGVDDRANDPRLDHRPDVLD